MLKVATIDADGVLIVSCETTGGPAYDPRWPHCEEVNRTIDGHVAPRVAVDLGACDYLTSAGIGFLIGLKRRTEIRGGRCVLCRIRLPVLDVLRLMRLDRFFDIADNLDDALARLPADP